MVKGTLKQRMGKDEFIVNRFAFPHIIGFSNPKLIVIAQISALQVNGGFFLFLKLMRKGSSPQLFFWPVRTIAPR